MGVKYTPEMLAKMGLKIHEKTHGHTKASPKGDLFREPAKKRKKQKVSAKGTDCKFMALLIQQELGVEAVEEYVFHPDRKWRFDLAIPSHKIAIEVEGGVWTNGRHTRGSGFLGDMEKYNAGTSLGWRIIRVVPEELTKTKTMKTLKQMIQQNET